MHSDTEHVPSSKAPIDSYLFVSLLSILTLFALFHTLQTFYFFQHRSHTIARFFSIGFPILMYYWYFLGLAFCVRWLAEKFPLEGTPVFYIVLAHLMALTLSFFLHQVFSLAANTTIWGWKWKTQLLQYKVFNNPSVWMEFVCYLLFLLGFYLLEYKRKMEEQRLLRLQLEGRLTHTRLQELRRKIHPQFLFNTLDSISRLLRTNAGKDANKILILLSDFLRATVYADEGDYVELEDQLLFLRQYLEIEKIRLPQMRTIEVPIEQAVRNALIPNFILQPVIEDLIDRTIERTNSDLHIKIRSQSDGKTLSLEASIVFSQTEDAIVNDDGDGKAVQIVRKRLAQLYGGEEEFSVLSLAGSGLKVMIRIPLHKKSMESDLVIFAEESA